MNKLLKFLFSVLILALILETAYLIYLNYPEFTRQQAFYFSSNKSIEVENFSSYSGELQFLPNMRFNHNVLTYSVDSACDEEKIGRVRQAVQVLEDRTGILEFKQIYNVDENQTDIYVSCTDSENRNSEKVDFFIAGEGGPTSVIDSNLYRVIERGKILLFYKKACSYNVELHELLHVFGFIHSNNEKSIMYNFSTCDQALTSDIIDKLKELYSIKPLADLYFYEANISRHGIYLDAKIFVKNQGLYGVGDAYIEFHADDKKIDEFELKDVDYGSGKILSIENVKIPVGASSLKIKIDSYSEELDYSNNEIEFSF